MAASWFWFDTRIDTTKVSIKFFLFNNDVNASCVKNSGIRGRGARQMVTTVVA
jgi:hypothetical protein